MKCLQRYCTSNEKKKVMICISMCLLFNVLLVWFSLCVGTVNVKTADVIAALAGEKSMESNIIMNIRIPRTCAAFLVGMALSAAGLIIQSVLDNPLAGPNILGINTGAGLGYLISNVFFQKFMGAGFFGSFIGAVVTTYIVLFVAGKIGNSRKTTILTGIAVNSIFISFIDIIIQFYPESLGYHQNFKVGSFTGITIDKLYVPMIVIFILLCFLIFAEMELQIIKMGDEVAISLGLPVARWKNLMLLSAAVLIGISVSICGILSFIGLIVPHICKKVIGENVKHLLLMIVLFGGGFTLLCDILARTVLSPYEIPVGIVSSMLGGGFFLWLLFRRRENDYN